MPIRLPRLRVVQALFVRDALVMRSYWLATAFDLVFGLLSLLIYYFISRTFHNVPVHELGGAPTYFAFAAVGVALALVVQASCVRVAQRIREDLVSGSLETLIAQPLTRTELALGQSTFHFSFGTVRAFLYLLVAFLGLGIGLSQASWPGLILVLLASGLAMTAVGIALSSFVLLLRRAEFLVAMAVLALTLLGGAFFPISVLPDWIEPIAKILPTRFIFGGVRAAVLRGEGWGLDFLYLVIFFAVGLPVAVAFFSFALNQARRRGRLTSY